MPHISTRSVGGATDDDVEEAGALRAWEALQRHLQAKNRAINAEVAHYPTPIARCDVQLSKLLEQRARVYRTLGRVAEMGALAAPDRIDSDWLRAVEGFIANAEPDAEDDAEIALRAELKGAIAALRRAA